MSAEENKHIVRRTFEEVFNKGNLALADSWVAATFVNHATRAAMLPGPESLKEHVVLLRTAFPDLHVRIEDLIADEEYAAAHVTFSGTHIGSVPRITSNSYVMCTSTDAYCPLR
jgi:predicted ester cyclase